MLRFQPFLSIVAVVAATSVAGAQNFEYTDFSSSAGLALTGNATVTNNVLRVAPASGNQTGAAYHATPVRVEYGFDTTFKFQITALSGGGADGMTFIIQNDPRGTAAMGDGGTELGYGQLSTSPAGTAIANSLTVEIDTWYSGGANDLSGNEVSIHTNGTGANNVSESYSLASITPATDMSDGTVHTMRVLLASGTLSVYLNDLFNPLLTAAWDMGTGGQWTGGGTVGGLSMQPGGLAWVGFTAATGGAWEHHDLLSWSFASGGGPGTPYCFGDASGNICPCGNLSIAGEGCANSLAMGGLLGSEGSPSVAAADLRLIANQLPPFKPGLFVMANDVQSGGSGSPYGDGLRCVGASETFVQIVFSDGAGIARSSVDLIATGNITGGTSKAFQYWYRDPFGPCSAGFNATNGLRVSFVP